MNFTIQRFWELIDDIRDKWDKAEDILQDFYIKELINLTSDEIIVFDHIFGELWSKLMYDPDFNDELYFKKMQFESDIIRMCFIDTIIITGEKIYLMAITNPKKFMDYHEENYNNFKFLLDCYFYIAENAFYEKNGKEIHKEYILRKIQLDPLINKIKKEFDDKIAFYKDSEENLDI